MGVAAKSLTAKSVAQFVGWRALPKLNEAHAEDLMDEPPEADSLVKAIDKKQRGRGHPHHSGSSGSRDVDPAMLNAGPYDALVDGKVVEGMGAADLSVYDILEPPIPSISEGAGVREDLLLHDASATLAVVPATSGPAARSLGGKTKGMSGTVARKDAPFF